MTITMSAARSLQDVLKAEKAALVSGHFSGLGRLAAEKAAAIAELERQLSSVSIEDLSDSQRAGLLSVKHGAIENAGLLKAVLTGLNTARARLVAATTDQAIGAYGQGGEARKFRRGHGSFVSQA